jgi:hypothetical protein
MTIRRIAVALVGLSLAAGTALADPVVKPAAKPAGAAAKPAHKLLVDFPATRAPATPPPAPKGPLTLIMRGLDKITGRATTLLIPIGKSTQFATLTITARYCYSTPSTETPETAAFVQIDDRRPDQPAKRIFSGWMYASSPGLNGMEHPLYDAWVMTCRAVAPGETVVIGPTKPVKPVSPDAPDKEAPSALPEDAGQ